MELAAFMVLALALCMIRLANRDQARALAYVAILCGLAVMAAIRGDAGGVLAFAVWTLCSYALLNFPVASTLYLFSAFCYILELQGAWQLQIQIASNLAGMAGLVAVWYGKPKWEHNFAWGSGRGYTRSVAVDVKAGNPRPAQRQEKP